MTKNRQGLNLDLLSLSKRKRKMNYSKNPSKTEKAPRVPHSPKQINLQEFQFFPERLQALENRNTMLTE
ncbi:hypothetical protein DFH11DRAFT_1684525 [Phellopilus nigrolimitatus]|nr:hypothetical protein DFH11DRAFT_1684525 [Phellopilus nigrolimitatus]